MTWDAEANELFPQTVTLTAPGTMNNYGRQAAGSSPSTRRALVEYKMRRTRNVQGQEAMSSVAVYLSGSGGVSGITPEWTILLPDDSTRPILSVNRFPDETGNILEVVYLQ